MVGVRDSATIEQL